MKVRFGKVSPPQANKTEISLYILQTTCTSLHILKTQLSFRYKEFANLAAAAYDANLCLACSIWAFPFYGVFHSTHPQGFVFSNW
jgi:hypothetical protein